MSVNVQDIETPWWTVRHGPGAVLATAIHDGHDLRPEVAASLTNKVFYANPNAASLKFVKKDVADNKTIFLPAAEKARMTPPDAVPQPIRRVQTRIFTNFKAGR